MARWMWLAAIALGLGEAGIAALALQPRVSTDYANYFIAQETDCWPRAVSGRYRLGEALSFRDDAGGRATMRHRQCGWLPPFAEGSYSVGDRARLRFNVAVPRGRALTIALVARGYVGGARPRQMVPITVNGQALDTLAFTDAAPAYHSIEVPEAVVALDPDGLTLQLDFPDRISPAEMGVNADRRELGILLSDLTILPGP